jgi:hypothetical protein
VGDNHSRLAEVMDANTCSQHPKIGMLQAMAQFTTRVELHGVILEAYGRLHSAMEHEGFSRTITAEDGISYVLPTGEYNRAGDNLTTAKVLSDAKVAAASVAARFSILVTESSARVWLDLQKAKI